MSDDFSASTGSAPDSTPTNVGEAASAGSPGAGEQTGQPQAADPNVSAAVDNQIDIGWSLEDKPEEAALPEGDEDIEGLMKDSNLDPARTPGLVTELRNARALAKESRRQVAELKQQITQLEQFGGIEGVNQAMGLVNGLLTNPEQGYADFMRSLHQVSYPAYEQLANGFIRAHPEYAVKQLQELGALPATQTVASQLTAEDWARIPQELRDIAKQVPANQLIEWLDKGTDESLLFNLQTHKELADLKGSQRSQAEQAWRGKYQEAQVKGQEETNNLANQFTQAHFKELSKWKPLGPDDESGNQTIYKMAFQGALDDLLSDPKFAQMHGDAFQMMAGAPVRRLRNESLAADQDERKARQLAAQVNTRLGQLLRDRVKLLDSVFRDARAFRESQRSNIPQRTEISGMSSATGSNGAPPTLTKDGKTNPAWLDHLVSRLPGIGSR